MNKKRINIILAVIVMVACFLPAAAQDQKNKAKKVTVESRLVDGEGNAISNAKITVGEGMLEKFSDREGNFSISTKVATMLLIEATGYESKWVDLAAGLPASEIVLEKDLLFSSRDDLIHLPLGMETHRRSLTGAVSKIEGEALKSYPDLNLSNALQGRLLGLMARQTTNGLGNNGAALYIRGLARGGADGIITVVDGVERPIDYLAAEEIESIEILKDATTKILYGPRAANGVLLITTKRGRPNTKVMKSSVEYGASFTTRMPEYLNSYEYAGLYNEARENDGLSPFYSQQDLEGYRNSSGPNDQRYPNVDYNNYFLNNSSTFRKAALEYSGGDPNNQYALVLAYTGGNGLEKVGTTPSLDRFNLRGNLDFKINNMISANIGTSGYVETQEWGSLNNSQVLSALSSHRPNEYPFIITDPDLQASNGEGGEAAIPPLGGSFHRVDNLYGSFLYGGFSESQAFYGQANVGFNFNLSDAILEGLSAKMYYTTDNFQYFQNGKLEVPVNYAQRWFQNAEGGETVEYYQLRPRVIEDNQRRQNQNFINNSGWFATLGYDKNFNNSEISTSLTHFYSDKDHDDWIQDLRFSNTVFRIKYGLNNKFYINGTLAYMGSDKMPKKNRYQLFPAIGAAWILSEEQFLADNQFLNFLKLKASFGILGYDRSTDYYLFQNRWDTAGNVQFDERNNFSTTQTNLLSIGNPDLGWEKSREINVGMEGLLFNNRLQFNFNYFNDYRYDIIQSPSYRYSVVAGDLFPQVNQGETSNRGIEGQLNWMNAVGDLKYSFGGRFIYSKNEVLKMNEVVYPEDLRYTRQTGQPSDAIFGYVAEGLFTSQSQLDNHANQTFGSYGLGSIAYADLNSDGVIDNLDRKVIGNNFPRTSLGLDLNLDYKGFGLYVLGTAELGVDNMLNNSYYWNHGEGKYSTVVNDRWHPTNNPDGTYPALTTTAGKNDFRNSTFWIQDASFFRLKNVELSYTLPVFSIANSLRFHLRGTNLFLISENKDLDPEALNSGVNNYPIFRTITGGVSVNF